MKSLLGLYCGSQFSPWVSQSLSLCAVSHGDVRGGLEITRGPLVRAVVYDCQLDQVMVGSSVLQEMGLEMFWG